MKNLLPFAALLAALVLPSCGEDDPTPAVTAKPYTATVTVTSAGTYSAGNNRLVVAQLRPASLRNASTTSGFLYSEGQGVTRGPGVLTFTELVEPTVKQVYLTLYYADVNRAGYVRPPAGEYVEAEITINGTSKGKVRVDAATFNTPANLWVDAAGKTNAVQELIVDAPK